MKIELQVLAGRSLDTNPVFLLECDSELYLFNVVQGTDRLLMQHNTRITRIKQIFLTDFKVPASGGLFNYVILQLWPNRHPGYGITGPENLMDHFLTTPFFFTRQQRIPPLSTSFSDDYLNVESIKLTSSVAFSIILPDLPGKFMPQKAKDLGVKPGPLFKQLKENIAVTLPDGRVIQPEDVNEPPIKGTKMLVFDCHALEDLALIPDVSQYSVVVHLADNEMIHNQQYVDFFKNVRSNICFLETDTLTFKTYAEIQTIPLYSTDIETHNPPENFQNMKFADSYSIYPPDKSKFTIIKDNVQPTHVELPKISSFAVTMLGTSARSPNKFRSDASLLVHTSDGYVLLDAGDNVFGQIRRKYGESQSNHILENLLAIFLSHDHIDHVSGLTDLLIERTKRTQKIIPLYVDSWVKREIDLIEPVYGSFYIDLQDCEAKVIEVKSVRIDIFKVEHTDTSKACILTIQNKWKIAYSGDRKHTQDEFVKNAIDLDLLIHEATIIDSEDKEGYMHSSKSDAFDVAHSSNAKYVILTHISPKNDEILDNLPDNAIPAYDFLEFTPEKAKETLRYSLELSKKIMKIPD